MFYTWVAVTLARFKYHFAWYLSEAGCIASGLGYNPTVSGTETVARWLHINAIFCIYMRYINIDILRTTHPLSNVFQYINVEMCIHYVLNIYIYIYIYIYICTVEGTA